MRNWRLPLFALAFILICGVTVHADETPQPQTGVAMHGEPKYKPGFDHVDYVNPNAPKGGDIHLASEGTFDSLNPYILKGDAAPGMGMTFQTLMTGTADEPFSEYGLIAESIEIPDDRSWVIFNLRKEAKWNDGTPITADDVVWTFNTLISKGHPFFHAYYAKVAKAEALSPQRVKFTFSMAGNRELPLIMGQMVVLPKHYWEGKQFDSTDLKEAPLGSGPYRVKSVDPGHRIVFERVKDWWAKDLPITKGVYNFDTITYDVYLDSTVKLQGLFSGAYDFNLDNSAKEWNTNYSQQKPVKEGLIKKEEIKNSVPAGMQAFVFNTRRAFFADPLVRRALNYAFDFEWSNKQLAFGAYKRTHSYFENSDLASSGLPTGRELEILQQYRGKIPDEIFTKEFTLPTTDGSGNDRENLSKAKQLLAQAGWKMGASGMLEKNGQPFKFEILLSSAAGNAYERWFNPFIANLKRLGVQAAIRYVDAAQYKRRLDDFDFDMILGHFNQSLSPGNEQRNFWGSDKADVKGSHNYIGVKDPVVDDLIEKLVSARDRDELVAICHALDRVLLWNYYVIPNWYLDVWRIAYWDKFGRPETTAKYDLMVPDSWWYDPQKAAKIEQKVAPDNKQ